MSQNMYIRSGELVIILRDKIDILKTLSRSLQFRIVLLVNLFVIISSIFVKAIMLENYEQRIVDMRIAEIQNQCTILGNQMLLSEYLSDTASEVINAELLQLSNIYNGRVIVVNDEFCIVKDSYSIQEGKTIVAEDIVKCFRGEQTSRYDWENSYIEVGTPIRQSLEGDVKGMILVSVSANSIQNDVEALESRLEAAVIIAQIITLIASIVIARVLVYPFRKMAKEINEITDGHEKVYVGEDAYLETAEISEAVNRTVERLQIVDKSREEFVANVSHELKTPLTSMKVLSDSLLTMPDAPIELYQEFMGDLSKEIERENKIINDLLELVKMDKTSQNIKVQMQNINELVERILKRLRPLASNYNIELSYESYRPVMAEVDEVKFALILTNLVENAIKYNHENGWVKVELNASHKEFYLIVSDSGIGIAKESVDHIFERFYRVDKSHSREIGGTGLGLAITRSAVAMHKGTIKVDSQVGKGTTFTIRIPLNYVRK